jgi:hypothetical protein
MLFIRLLMLLLLPVRLPIMLVRALFRVGRTAGANAEKAGAAAVAGGTSRALPDTEELDRRSSVFFVPLSVEESDELMIGPGDNEVARDLAAKAQLYYKIRPDLFPKGDFYESVEGEFIDGVTRIDNDGEQDQFVRMLDRARRVTNDNTRTMFCEVAPIALMLVLIWHGVMLIADPFLLLNRDTPLWSVQTAQVFATELMMAGAALGVALLVMTTIYSLSYANMQRQNALALNNFISIEFARLTNMFRVAQRECLQAEAMLSDSQRDEVMKKASNWALAYHWISVRQLLEEFVVRNAMFQIRRNTVLYVAAGFFVCVMMFVTLAIGGYFAANLVPNSHTTGWIVVLHFAAIAGVFVLLMYGLVMRKPVAIIASNLRKDEWNRFATLAVGDAIAEQVTRDKVQIIINRDRARAAGG